MCISVLWNGRGWSTMPRFLACLGKLWRPGSLVSLWKLVRGTSLSGTCDFQFILGPQLQNQGRVTVYNSVLLFPWSWLLHSVFCITEPWRTMNLWPLSSKGHIIIDNAEHNQVFLLQMMGLLHAFYAKHPFIRHRLLVKIMSQEVHNK